MSASASGGAVSDQVTRELAERGIKIDPAALPAFRAFLDGADRNIAVQREAGLLPVAPVVVDPQIGTLVGAVQAAATADGVLTDTGFAALRLKLCPGFWPFC